MKLLLCMIMSYFVGSLSPAALVSRVKKKDLREHGTGNLGATNTMLVFGKLCGALVMVFDIAKAYFVVKVAEFIFPAVSVAGLLAGGSAMLGHIFPFYMKFKGGKGLATFGGLILAHDALLFLVLLMIGCIVMLAFNYAVAMTVSAAILFPFFAGLRSGDMAVFAVAAAISVLIILRHLDNIERARNGTEIKIRSYIKGQASHSGEE
ncbi:MAG: glycerol-3-phosphate acyltransferase [Ruminococcus sp.]|nr:glycerol-3-phosphate acyltransferase [Ruminococcus sp.]